MSLLRRQKNVLNHPKTGPSLGEQIITGPITGFEKNNVLDFLRSFLITGRHI
jgi:hypothetical protein